jgi:signal transduction histidine kinase
MQNRHGKNKSLRQPGIESPFPFPQGKAGGRVPPTPQKQRLPPQEGSAQGDSPLQQSITVTNSLTLTHTQNVFSLEFSVLSYANPERNRFRYKLEGLETGWNIVPGTHRLVTYTTLPAGDYVLRVQGATNRGVWNDKGVALRLRILPPWWSTWWFRSLAAALVLLSLGSAHHFRLQNIERRINMRLEERVGERTRIARELHDTLLQSFQGLMLRFQVAYDEIPARPAEARKTLGNALDEAAQAIAEGRDAVQGLRSSTVETNDLAQAIGSLGEELVGNETNSNRVESFVDVEGTPRDVHPILRDEIYRIAGEALRNAFRHAQARRIEVAITYGERQFRLRVHDDGKGIDSEVLEKRGRAGHWGLAGMRERAARIGGNIEIRSRHESGTEVELNIPASIAYATPAHRRSRLFPKMPFAKKTGTNS